jgi:NAD(P)-dependent dehydrogenase (short-subunit alcohol dehydrogenase family)
VTAENLTGLTALVTGANSGIGLPTSRELARRGAHVIVACRNEAAGQALATSLRQEGCSAEFQALNLADLASVRAAAGSLNARLSGLDILVNNAGVGMIPRQLTVDGFEMQLGTNHFGHFALTGLVLPLLLARPNARVVTVSSDAHEGGELDLDDLEATKNYGRTSAYARSKLANLLFALELQRRAEAAGVTLLSLASDPGTTSTNIFKFGLLTKPINLLMRPFIKSAEEGAKPSLHAATAPDVAGGQFYGPGPALVTPAANARNEATAARLWEISTQRTGVRFEMLERQAR